MNEEKYSEKSEIYDASRPRYPKGLFDYLYSSAGLSEESIIADVGAGTGILAQGLLEQGSIVYCIEFNRDMRTKLETVLKDYNNLISINATAEATTLGDSSVDFITAGQAFHWFDKEQFKAECQRILKPNGKVVIAYNLRVIDDPATKECYDLTVRLCPNLKLNNGHKEFDSNFDKDFYLSGFFDEDTVSEKCFLNNVNYNEKMFVCRHISVSYAPNKGGENYDEFVSGLQQIFRKYADASGVLVMPHRTFVFTGEVEPVEPKLENKNIPKSKPDGYNFLQ